MTGNLEKAYQTLELWLQTYPGGEQPTPLSLLGGLSTHGTGRFDRAIGASRQAIADAPDLALALSGDSSRSSALADDLEKRFPEDTFARFTYGPVLRALAALARGRPADSVERLQMALPYELAANGLNFHHVYLGGLHSAYVRGEALLAAHRYGEAAAEFQKILDHRGIVGADPIGARAHLELGRAFVLTGDTARARTAYQDFLALWKDADPDVPILRQARAEFARLH